MHRFRVPALRLVLLFGAILTATVLFRLPHFQALWALHQAELCAESAFRTLPPAVALHPAIECAQQAIPRLGDLPEGWKLMEWALNARTTYERHPVYLRQVLRSILRSGKPLETLLQTLMESLVLLTTVLGAGAVLRRFRWEEPVAEARLASAEKVQMAGAQRHVLIIDDDPRFAKGVARMLQKKGITSDVATSRNEAEQKLLTSRYDTVFCDYHLDEGLGSQLCRDALGKAAYRSCVILSGKPEEELTGLSEGDKEFAFVQKPCDSKVLEKIAKSGVK